jgi:hypothetical protein
MEARKKIGQECGRIDQKRRPVFYVGDISLKSPPLGDNKLSICKPGSLSFCGLPRGLTPNAVLSFARLNDDEN